MHETLVCISKVKNEADFIEYSTRANASIFSEMHFIDDNSADNTIEILAQLAKEGLPVFIYSLQDRNERLKNLQGGLLTALMRHLVSANNYGNGYIVPLDADEIILCGREDMLAQLRIMPRNHYGLMQWMTFVPINGGNSKGSCIENSFKPLAKEQRAFHKVVIPINHSRSSVITKGSHSIFNEEIDLRPYILDIDLGHFPVRSANQLVSKCLISAHKTRIRQAKDGENYHLLRVAERIRFQNYEVSDQELYELALDYLGGRKGEILQGYDLRKAIPGVSLAYISRPIKPICALDALLMDLIG
ncbi:glycosyltransferase family 2 protein [Synechococcus sp. CBW1107]|uniref:glycosyltransferase family 2 protein n=1 Tax=Synechococcus sp. CBW1107 TaxID=2789857 RepID=UPI002AD444B3|nr:glycosyltransferase family 2 protein [Synechococcus sp. CBW1107]CAK6701847.1 hypothetical protein IFHNHDMJ_03245 [Synechococcus sp. CBW1107]